MIEKVKCPNCQEEIFIDLSKEANYCEKCKEAFITKKALKVADNKGNKTIKKRNVFKTIGSVLLLVLQCIGYLIYVISLMWLFFDIVDKRKK